MKKRKLTQKQKDFISFYLETGNGVQSALKAYDTTDYMTAHAIASENLQKPAIRDSIDELTRGYGFDDYYLRALHARLLDGENSTVAVRALDMAYKLRGAYSPKKSVSELSKLDDDQIDERIGVLISGVLEVVANDHGNTCE